MARLRSAIDPRSDTARANADAMRALVDDLRSRTARLSENGAAGDERSIAVVGSRRASPAGLERAWRIASELSEAGNVIVSGLAAGELRWVEVPTTCRPGDMVVVAIDPADQIDESHESDNGVTRACPAAA